jgi:hypothetical protein
LILERRERRSFLFFVSAAKSVSAVQEAIIFIRDEFRPSAVSWWRRANLAIVLWAVVSCFDRFVFELRDGI